MDNKKLLQALLRDVIDLEDLILSLKSTGASDPLDFEWMQTKISGVRHLLEVMGQREDNLLQSGKEQISGQRVAEEISAESGRSATGIVDPQLKEVAEDLHTETRQSHPEVEKVDAVTEPVPEPENEPAFPSEPKPEPRPEPVSPPEYMPVAKPEPEVYDLPSTAPVTTSTAEEEDELELEEVAASGKQTLGERFVQSRSVNDLLLEHSKSESRYSNLPVTSLQSAIGINDKFLFTRELFDGDAKAFNEAVRKLDSMTGIHEAAGYLRENFKWKKTDTSLKFIDLVKRRFM